MFSVRVEPDVSAGAD